MFFGLVSWTYFSDAFIYSFLYCLISDSGLPSMIALIQRRSNSSTFSFCISGSHLFFCQWWDNQDNNQSFRERRSLAAPTQYRIWYKLSQSYRFWFFLPPFWSVYKVGSGHCGMWQVRYIDPRHSYNRPFKVHFFDRS